MILFLLKTLFSIKLANHEIDTVIIEILIFCILDQPKLPFTCQVRASGRERASSLILSFLDWPKLPSLLFYKSKSIVIQK